jgi:PEP-CTERM motif
MKRSIIAALSGGLIAMIAASSAAEAGTIDFGVISIDGSITFLGGPSLDQSNTLDLDLAGLVVNEILPGDQSGLNFFDPVSLTANTSQVSSQIIYTSGLGSLGAVVTLTWVATSGPGVGDVFNETLTTVTAINRAVMEEIGLELTGTVSDNSGSFFNVPILLNLTASESMGLIDVEFTNATTSVTPSIPEPSTWVMMALGFGAVGYAGFGRRASRRSRLAY